MNYRFPYTIENCVGEKIIFQSVEKTPQGEKVILEAFCKPGCGPKMHTHFKQEEELTVVSGRMGYQLSGEKPKVATAGESVLFTRGVSHKFWAEGNENLHCKGWIMPANSIVFFLSALYAAQNKSGKSQPETFDAAYLMTRYAAEYDIPEIPYFVKKTVIPLTYHIGQLLGKYKHFEHAPEPLK
ncbi:MAG: cupin domain-containing protein [Sphingobacteriales bacterium]|jgi:mannose-6-phosphate isomerase-like protein (cupin superfamily)|nr:cupin domain-containing protein [Sphingobacteriales bacterium]